jgi:hypothetical protein
MQPANYMYGEISFNLLVLCTAMPFSPFVDNAVVSPVGFKVSNLFASTPGGPVARLSLSGPAMTAHGSHDPVNKKSYTYRQSWVTAVLFPGGVLWFTKTGMLPGSSWRCVSLCWKALREREKKIFVWVCDAVCWLYNALICSFSDSVHENWNIAWHKLPCCFLELGYI